MTLQIKHSSNAGKLSDKPLKSIITKLLGSYLFLHYPKTGSKKENQQP